MLFTRVIDLLDPCGEPLINGFAGELQSVDGYMNIALEKTEEYVNGKLRRNYGDAFVRGNNGLSPSSLWFRHLAF